MLKRFPELAKLPYKTVPLQPAHVNKEPKVVEPKPLSDIDEYITAEYPKIVGTMIYIAITARPDVAFAIAKLSRGMHCPNKLHCAMLKDVVGYLRNTITLPLGYPRKPLRVSMLLVELASGDAALAECHSHNFAEGVSENVRLCNMHPGPLMNLTDSSYAPPNEKSRRSVSGRCHYHLGNLVAWRSKLQPLTAASTLEAEPIAVSSAAGENVWLRSLLLKCGFVIPSISGFYEMPSSTERPTFYVFVKETSHRVSLFVSLLFVSLFVFELATVKLRFIGLVTQGHRSIGLITSLKNLSRVVGGWVFFSL